MSTLIWIVIFMLVLGVVIFIHELGHYLAAKRAGVFVEEFSLGMGPKLFFFRGRKKTKDGETTVYSLRMFPIGGFCRLRGQDDDSDITDESALNNKTVPQRMLVMAGGSLMNFLLAFVLFFILTLVTGYATNEIRALQENGPAHQAGLQAGDRITHINGTRVSLFENFSLQLEFSGGEPLDLRVNRDGTVFNVTATPSVNSRGFYWLGSVPVFRQGLFRERTAEQNRVGLWGSVTTSVEMMFFNIRLPFTMLTRWITNQPMPEGANVMGPIGMAGEFIEFANQAQAESVGLTIEFALFFTALLSAALGLFNLLPIPAMDGARLVFLGIEGIRRKPVPPERERLIHLAGFVLIIGLAIFIAYRDIVRLLPL
jgi:regulator of sigma E protease